MREDQIEIIAYEDAARERELCRVTVDDVQMAHDAMDMASLDASRRKNLDIKAEAIIHMHLPNADTYPHMAFDYRPIRHRAQ